MSHQEPSQSSRPEMPQSDSVSESVPEELVKPRIEGMAPRPMVETAFLASTASLIWLINYYFPLGPLLRIFFPTPIALSYLRWGKRTAWMTALVTGLLLSVLMGPPRSLQFFLPYGFLGVALGGLWRRRVSWPVSIGWGTLIAALGFFLQLGLVSLLLGENLWVYGTAQVTKLAEWLFVKLGILAQPDLLIVQTIVVAMIVINAFLYLLLVHLAAWLLLDRLGNPIPPPPVWLQVLLDHEG